MSELASWSDLKAGLGCPFDPPRAQISDFMSFVCRLSASTLYLSKEQTYRGACVLIFDPRHVTRIDELTASEWARMAEDLRLAQAGIFRAVQPDHINVESLGSVVPHLHWHIIPRYKGDPRWGGPIWMTRMDEMVRTELEETDFAALTQQISAAVAGAA